MAFMVSSTMTAVAGALFAYYRNFVSIDAFSLYLTVQYVAMIIIGGMGSISGALLGSCFVILFPYAIEAVAACCRPASATWCSRSTTRPSASS